MTNTELISLFQERRSIFNHALQFSGYSEHLKTCPACGMPTLTAESSNDVCDICNWEDVGLDDDNADVISEENDGITLTDARLEFQIQMEEEKEDGNYEFVKKPVEVIEAVLFFQDIIDHAVDEDEKNNTYENYIAAVTDMIEDIRNIGKE